MKHNLWKLQIIIFSTLTAYSTAILGGNTVTLKSSKHHYTDDDIEFDSGRTELHSHAYTITAKKHDVHVHVKHKSIIECDDDTRIHFVAHKDKTVRITIDHSLRFKGAKQDKPLFMTFGGPGKIIFELEDGAELHFGSTHGHKPVKAFVLMDDPCYATGERPSLILRRKHRENSLSGHEKDVDISIHPHSLVSYLSQHKDLFGADDQASIEFDPGNAIPSHHTAHPGSMKLKIHNGGFIVTGHWVKTKHSDEEDRDENDSFDRSCLYKQRIKWDDVHLKIAAGHRAVARVKISEHEKQGGLVIENHTSRLSELLCDPFFTLEARKDHEHYRGDFNGHRHGCILGANAVLEIDNNTFIDYRSYKGNECPDTLSSVEHYKKFPVHVHHLLKKRNPSAFIIDGNNNPDADPAEIRMSKHSGLFFRSLHNSHHDEGSHDHIVDHEQLTPGNGEYVFVVEAPLRIHGKNNVSKHHENTQLSKIELLSLQVKNKNGTLARTFNRVEPTDGDYEDEGCYLGYNKAAWLINDAVHLYDVSLDHTDTLHHVYRKNDFKSEPTYVGGEKWILGCDQLTDEDIIGNKTDDNESTHTSSCCRGIDPALRPHFSLFNAQFNIHTDVAFTGMDIIVPNLVTDYSKHLRNISKVIFYQNNRKIDCGFGRNLILGTYIGSTACDDCTVLNSDANLRITQKEDGDYDRNDHILLLETGHNSSDIVEHTDHHRTPDNHHNVNSIYLGYNSIIAIGSLETDDHENDFESNTTATLTINGNHFAISARGGVVCDPRTAHITGQGGIFVDRHGVLDISKHYRATIDTMVTRSSGSHVHLPSHQVKFGHSLGIAHWKPNICDQMRQVLIDTGEQVPQYILNWADTDRYSGESWRSQNDHAPYNIPSPQLNKSQHISQEQVQSLATIRGTVHEFHIQGSRIGDEAHIAIDGGIIKELVFAPTDHDGELAAAAITIKNAGTVGIGSMHRNTHNTYDTPTLGIDGVTVIADGTGRVIINQDITVTNRCAFLKGPNFYAGKDSLEITSLAPRTIRVTSTGCLDLQAFNDPRDIVRFGGHLRLVLDPGATIILGGGVCQIANNTKLIFEPHTQAQEHFDALLYEPLFKCGNHLNNTNGLRVKIAGHGTIQLTDNAQAFIDKDAFVGVETLVDRSNDDTTMFDPNLGDWRTIAPEEKDIIHTTNITLELKHNALFSLGEGTVTQGGSLQIGNPEFRNNHDVQFKLVIDGTHARFNLGAQSFLGLAGGIIRRCAHDTPNDWLVGVLSNVSNISIDIKKGTFSHAQIYEGSDHRASLLMIGDHTDFNTLPTTFTMLFPQDNHRKSEAQLQGGGNIVHLKGSHHAFQPVITHRDGFVPVQPEALAKSLPCSMQVGILASRALIGNNAIKQAAATTFFEAIKTAEGTSDPNSRNLHLANAAINRTNASGNATECRVACVDRGTIVRNTLTAIRDPRKGLLTRAHEIQEATSLGALIMGTNLNTDTPQSVCTAMRIV